MINLRELSQNAANKICRFLDDRTILRMREISKHAMGIAVFGILNSRNTGVSKLSVDCERRKNDTLKCEYHFGKNIDFSIWKACFHCDIAKHFNVNFEVDDNGQILKAQFESDSDLAQFFEYLKPLIQRTSILELEIAYITRYPRIVKMITNVFVGRTVNELTLLYEVEDTEWSMWYDFLNKIVGTKFFYCRVNEYSKDSRAGLRKIGETVEEISVYAFSNASVMSILSLAHAVLDGKCSNLTITWENYSAELTAVDIEKIVQGLHRLENKVSIDFVTSNANWRQMTDRTIGCYRTRRDSQDALNIEHLEI